MCHILSPERSGRFLPGLYVLSGERGRHIAYICVTSTRRLAQQKNEAQNTKLHFVECRLPRCLSTNCKSTELGSFLRFALTHSFIVYVHMYVYTRSAIFLLLFWVGCYFLGSRSRILIENRRNEIKLVESEHKDSLNFGSVALPVGVMELWCSIFIRDPINYIVLFRSMQYAL